MFGTSCSSRWRIFIQGGFFENRPSKTVSLQNKQTNKQNQTFIYYIYYILYIVYYILYIVYYILYVVCCLLFVVYGLKEKISLLDLDYSHRTMFMEEYTVGFFFLRSKTLFPALFSGVQIAFRTGLFSP